jgi:hypothetical protein
MDCGMGCGMGCGKDCGMGCGMGCGKDCGMGCGKGCAGCRVPPSVLHGGRVTMSAIVLFGLFMIVVYLGASARRRIREARAAQIEYDRRRAEVVLRAVAAQQAAKVGAR